MKRLMGCALAIGLRSVVAAGMDASVLVTNVQFWGAPGYTPVVGDYDGDQRDDWAVYGENSGAWYIQSHSADTIAYGYTWGGQGFDPVSGDFDGDGIDDLAVYQTATGDWFVLSTAGRILAWAEAWGLPGLAPVTADFNGDGANDLAVYGESGAYLGYWFGETMSNQVTAWNQFWGAAGCLPAPGDYDGDGKTDFGVYYEPTGAWYVKSRTGDTYVWAFPWGYTGCEPAPADYDGDGADDLAVYDERAGVWYVYAPAQTSTVYYGQSWGGAGYEPVPGDYDGDGDADLAVYSASNGYWYVRVPAETIDVHAHLDNSDFTSAVRTAVSSMNTQGVAISIIMPPPSSTTDLGAKYDVDDFTNAIRAYTNRIAYLGGGGILNLMIQRAVTNGVTTQAILTNFTATASNLLAKGARGFGEFAVEHFSMDKTQHPYIHAPADHTLFLKLAEIAAAHGVPLDIHMEAVLTNMALPNGLTSPNNPAVLTNTLDAFERLLESHRGAVIIWDHLGWDNTGQRTVALTTNLMAKHTNLYVSVKIASDMMFESNRPLDDQGHLKAEWLPLFQQYPDRILVGSDHFHVGQNTIGATSFGSTWQLLNALPGDLARKIAVDNPRRIFRLP